MGDTLRFKAREQMAQRFALSRDRLWLAFISPYHTRSRNRYAAELLRGVLSLLTATFWRGKNTRVIYRFRIFSAFAAKRRCPYSLKPCRVAPNYVC